MERFPETRWRDGTNRRTASVQLGGGGGELRTVIFRTKHKPRNNGIKIDFCQLDFRRGLRRSRARIFGAWVFAPFVARRFPRRRRLERVGADLGRLKGEDANEFDNHDLGEGDDSVGSAVFA